MNIFTSLFLLTLPIEKQFFSFNLKTLEIKKFTSIQIKNIKKSKKQNKKKTMTAIDSFDKCQGKR